MIICAVWRGDTTLSTIFQYSLPGFLGRLFPVFNTTYRFNAMLWPGVPLMVFPVHMQFGGQCNVIAM